MAEPSNQRQRRAPSAHADPLLGRIIDGRYTLLNLIGRGGMGTVYKAHQASLERAVAIKILAAAPTKAREQEFQQRFFLEAATAAKLKHPNTITVFDFGSDVVDDTRLFFIAMEYLDGVTLTRALNESGLTVDQSVHILLQLTRSLREAHGIGVVHRDLKPGNIMLIRAGDEDDADEHFVKVLDFGLAKTFAGDEDAMNLTRVGTFLGSPRYVSPEQIEGKEVDPRADIYSLGCVMFRMLEGKVPFDGDTPVEVMLKHLNETPPEMVSEIPNELKRLVLDCLLKAPIERPQNMSEVIRRLKLIRAAMGAYSVSPDSADDRGTPSRGIVAPDLQRQTPTVPTVRNVGQVPISDEPPRTTSFGHRREKKKKKRGLSPLLVALVVALVTAGGFVYAFETGLIDRLTKGKGATTTAPPAKKGVRHKVRVKTDPEAGVTVYEKRAGGQRDRLGLAPMTLDWRFIDGTPRVLEFTHADFITATVDVSPPEGAKPGAVFPLDVKLVPRQ